MEADGPMTSFTRYLTVVIATPVSCRFRRGSREEYSFHSSGGDFNRPVRREAAKIERVLRRHIESEVRLAKHAGHEVERQFRFSALMKIAAAPGDCRGCTLRRRAARRSPRYRSSVLLAEAARRPHRERGDGTPVNSVLLQMRRMFGRSRSW